MAKNKQMFKSRFYNSSVFLRKCMDLLVMKSGYYTILTLNKYFMEILTDIYIDYHIISIYKKKIVMNCTGKYPKTNGSLGNHSENYIGQIKQVVFCTSNTDISFSV